MSRRRLTLPALLLAQTVYWTALAPACAMTGLIYQPLIRDREVAEAEWPGIFAEVRRYGFDTLILQWTRYGQAFAEADERQWLMQRIQQARAAGLRIIFGLAADPGWFQRIMQSGPALDDYLRQLARDDAAQARRLLASLPADAIGGWYLPAELDDLHWREEGRRAQLLNWLTDAVAQLDAVAERPIYISTFFTGKMHPLRYLEMLTEVRLTGARPWVQDGRGTGVLTEAETRLYLAPLLNCQRTPVDAIVHELFVQQPSASGEFIAHSIGLPGTTALLASDAPCRGRRIFFSLRYLPGLDRVMRTPGAQSSGVTPP